MALALVSDFQASNASTIAIGSVDLAASIDSNIERAVIQPIHALSAAGLPCFFI